MQSNCFVHLQIELMSNMLTDVDASTKQECIPVGPWPRVGVCPGAVSARGVPCDLSHHAFDVTCMLSPHQLRASNNAAAYILLVGHVTCKACWDTPPCGQADTCKNITFATSLRAVNTVLEKYNII